MLVISSREFRDNQKEYFDQVDKGREVLIKRGKNKSYRLVPVTDDDTLMSKEEFLAKIERAMQDAKEGKGIVINSEKELNDYFDKI